MKQEYFKNDQTHTHVAMLFPHQRPWKNLNLLKSFDG